MQSLTSSSSRSRRGVAVALLLASVSLGALTASAASVAVGDVAELRIDFFAYASTVSAVAGAGSGADPIARFQDAYASAIAFETQNQLLVSGILPLELETDPGYYEDVPALVRVDVASGNVELISRDGFLGGLAVAFGPQGAVVSLLSGATQDRASAS